MAASTLPGKVDLDVYRGDTWSQKFRFAKGGEPVDLTGATVAAQARLGGGTKYNLTTAITDAVNGEVQLSMPAGGLPVGSYSYDLEVVQAGVTTTWIYGLLIITRDVTNELP